MTHQQSTLSSNSGCRIYTQNWQPSDEPKAVLILVHGLAEHSNRYVGIANYFTEQGYAVYALDHEGHGHSQGLRGYINSFDDFLTTLDQYLNNIANQHPGKKLFLVGHSMGGVISSAYLLEHQQKLAGCILSGAALATGDVISPVQKVVLNTLSKVLPKLPVLQLEANDVCHDPAVVEAYKNDPHVFTGKIRVRLITEILRTADRVLKNAANISLPMLILHGGDDKMASPSGSEKLYAGISSSDKTLKIYPGLYHEIFLEPEKLEIYATIHTWLEQKLA
ncbi:alpha/beta hydrolase [Zhongshania marina]|jgi:alpha-beta hydrolase superfamily lysophospholipase|uniref:Monoacylglycerol lipase n=1 Tax=Zhongshania marina TaxID=2304603 RepID=A0A2S4HIW3_9GAMM|nr:alpha/beta hydrolase [Marortus luteolus]POP53918.1 alpha/beta hydrolase [Marortus luteolus]